MRRREFVTLVGAAAAWPFAAEAQQGDRPRLVGVVAGFSEAEMRAPLTAFRSKLKELGWAEGRNLIINARLGSGDYQRMTSDAGKLVSRSPDIVVTLGTPGLNAVRQHSRVPVVFTMVADPVRTGLIENLARPVDTQRGSPTLSSLSVENGWSCSEKLAPL